MRRLLLIDANNLFIRNYIVNTALDFKDRPVGGVLGFLRSLGELSNLSQADEVICVWDGENGSGYRRSIYKGYKDGRKPIVPNTVKQYGLTPDQVEFSRQYQNLLVRKYLNFTPVKQLEIKGCEADDVIAFLTNHFVESSNMMLVSTDRDYYQLLRPGVILYRPGSKAELLDASGVIAESNIHPTNYALYKCLLGDHSDNIKGIYGLGEKTIPKIFPMLCDSERVTLDVLKQHCFESVDKNRHYKNCLDNFLVIETNYKICQLYEPPLTMSQISAILYNLEEFDSTFQYKGLLEECKEDSFKHHINLFGLWDELKRLASSVISE